MAWLYQATTTSKGIQMGNEEFAHTLSIGTNWTKLRLGWRGYVSTLLSFNANPLGTIILGVCTGTQELYKSPICTEFMGFNVSSTIALTWTFANSPANHVANPRPNSITKLNGAFTIQGTASQNAYISAVSTARTQMFVDITKNSATNYTIQTWMPGNTTQATTDNTFNSFISAIENNTTPTNCATQGASTFSWAGPGLMDTMYFGWQKSIPVLTTLDICACRLI